MEKSLFEQMGGIYYREGDYLLPDLTSPENVPVGIWGQRRRRYLKQHRQALYTGLLLSGKLNSHLTEIDQQAEETFSQLVKQMATKESVTEQLKAENQMEGVKGHGWGFRDKFPYKRQWTGELENWLNKAIF